MKVTTKNYIKFLFVIDYCSEKLKLTIFKRK